MLDQTTNHDHQWQGLNQHINQWLEHRATLLKHYCKVANLPPYERNDNSLPTIEEIHLFCGDLLDYVSEGHFEIYEEIMDAYEATHHEQMKVSAKIVPEINKTTDLSLQFNDKYTTLKEPDSGEFDLDLCELGEIMERRFELEDILLEQLRNHTQN